MLERDIRMLWALLECWKELWYLRIDVRMLERDIRILRDAWMLERVIGMLIRYVRIDVRMIDRMIDVRC